MIEAKPLLFVACLLATASSASAQEAIRCASFLHNRDGTWRSFYQVDLLAPNGVVHVDEGERLSPAAKSPKGDVARALNELCAAR